MSASEWLTQEELLAELGHAGIAVAERTLRFWVSKGVLSAPVRKPYRGADGRVGYYPRETLALVPRILKLQEEGWKLQQIKQRLAESPAPSGKPGQVAWKEGEQAARLYLADLLTDSEARDRRRCFSGAGAADSDLRQLRHYLVARLERWLGRGTAVRATSAFLLELSEKDLLRLSARLRINSGQRLELESGEPIGFHLQALLAGPRRQAAGRSIDTATESLRTWVVSPDPPLLLLRALAAMTEIAQELEKESGSPTYLAASLAQLEEIQKQAEMEMAFLAKADT